MSATVKWLALAWLAVLNLPATAHELSMAEMEMRETSRGEFQWLWIAGGSRPASQELRPVWPQGCREQGNSLSCGSAGLQGQFSVEGVGERYSAAVVKVYWIDGQSSVYTLTSGRPQVQLFGSAEDRRSPWDIGSAYAALGVEHILAGIDHVMFVACLLFLVGFNRRLLLTITAFTAAHSLTLGLSAMDWLSLNPPPVEATIALSIMLVAKEALTPQPTLSRRWPALVALLFGLVHGLGFAGALRDIGLPHHHLLVALLSFNLGVEFGQLLVVTLACVLYRAVRIWPRLAVARAPALYAIGSVAAFWSVGRIVRIWA
ncbi:MAG: HupE/UreJ family protein [Panacagrimonas sp.]